MITSRHQNIPKSKMFLTSVPYLYGRKAAVITSSINGHPRGKHLKETTTAVQLSINHGRSSSSQTCHNRGSKGRTAQTKKQGALTQLCQITIPLYP